MLKRRNIEKPLLYQLNKNSFQSGIALSKVTALASLRTDGVIIEVVRPAEKMPSHDDLKTSGSNFQLAEGLHLSFNQVFTVIRSTL